MSEKTVNILKMIGYIISFIVAIVLVFIGRTTYGWKGLGIMFVGFAILLVLLYLYNKKYQ